MKFIFILSFFFSVNQFAFGQELSFTTDIWKCTDHWVITKGEKNMHNYGFVYINDSVGLSYQQEGSFTINKEGKYILNNQEKILKQRSSSKSELVAIFPISKFKDLKLKTYPNWYKFRKYSDQEVTSFFTTGFVFNRRKSPGEALINLLKVYHAEPDRKNLRYELALAYNMAEMYVETRKILKNAVTNEPTSYKLYFELVIANLALDNISGAEIAAKKSISLCAVDAINFDVAYKMAAYYSAKSDENNFIEWYKKAKDFIADDDENKDKLSALKRQ